MAKSKKARGLDELAVQIRVCTRCPLHESRTHAVPGEGRYTAKVKEDFALLKRELRKL